jgi:hypothetical protein
MLVPMADQIERWFPILGKNSVKNGQNDQPYLYTIFSTQNYRPIMKKLLSLIFLYCLMTGVLYARHKDPRDGSHDFDFEIGAWKTHLKRLQHPLTGSNTWVEYDGTTVVSKVWNGKANLVELEVDGPTGHIEALSVRLYDPKSGQWSLNFAGSSSNTFSQPTIGEFKDGRGEFYDQETYNGRAILLRFVIIQESADVCRFEQSFSADGGKTWELNWVATDTRVK